MLVKMPFLLWFLCVSCLYAEHQVPSKPANVRAKETEVAQTNLLQKLLLGQVDSLEVSKEKSSH